MAEKKFHLWRILAILLLLVLIGGLIIGERMMIVESVEGLCNPSQSKPAGTSGNSIMVIVPYRHADTWVFDDPVRDLKQEPFVLGIPELIDQIVKNVPNAENGFRALFSAEDFPGAAHKLIWKRKEKGGNWYYSPEYDKEGWLCPSLLKYFPEAPKTIYIRAEPLE